jgi:predicted RNase H-like HicB family nuclease
MSYVVRLEHHEDGWWIARVSGVKGVHSNGRSIDEAMRRVREALSLAVDDAEGAELVPDVQLPTRVKNLLERQAEARRRAQEEQDEASRLQARAALELTEKLGLSLRDAGALLGVSHMMASKALQAARGGRATTRTRAQPTRHVRKARKSTAAR